MASEIKITRSGYRCLKCGKEWIGKFKGRKPEKCPKCKSPKWDVVS